MVGYKLRALVLATDGLNAFRIRAAVTVKVGLNGDQGASLRAGQGPNLHESRAVRAQAVCLHVADMPRNSKLTR